MSYSLNRLVDLIESRGFIPNNFFTFDGKYKLIEIISFKNAVSLLIDIDSMYSFPAEKRKHEYEMTKKDIDSSIAFGSINEADLRTKYQEIDHISKALESEEKLTELYDKPISLKGDEDKSRDKLASTERQIKRFRLCVRNITYKMCLFDDNCLCLLNSNSDPECYYLTDYKVKKRKIYIVSSLKNFFNVIDIDNDVSRILDQFHKILSDNQKLETNKIQSMIDSKQNIANQSRRIMDLKQKLYTKIIAHQKIHQNLTEKQMDLQRKIKDLKTSVSRGVSYDNERQMREGTMRKEIEDIENKRTDIVKVIIDTRKDLDELSLVVDNILFDNMVMMTKINYNFKVLEQLK